MALLIDDIAQYLEDEELGTVGEDIFKSKIPDDEGGTYSDIIVVLETGGVSPDPYIPTKSPTFQVYVRASDYESGREVIESIRTALHQKANITLVSGGNYYYYILALGEPGHIGQDEQGRDEFSINFRAKTQ